jgi:CelD/BcsL family acetyltransferase involved in cellulose biosynthesis
LDAYRRTYPTNLSTGSSTDSPADAYSVVYVTDAIGDLGAGELGGTLPARGEWEALAERAGAPPFLWPGWVAAWARAFGSGALDAVEVRRRGELVAVLPMLRRGKALRSPSNWHTPVFGPLGIDTAAREELLARLFEQPARTVELNHLGGCSPQTDAVVEAAREEGRMIVTRTVARSPFIPLEGHFEDFEGSLARNRRKALRRHRRRLGDLGELRFEVHDGRTDLEGLLEELFAVEGSGWKGRNGTAISSRANTKGFYTDVARWAAERGWLRLAFHRLDGRPIAGDFALEQGGVWYTLKAGYDEDFRALGPGALLLRDEIAHCFERGVSRIELLGHLDSFKASWTDRFSERSWIRAFSRSPAGISGWAGAAGWERARPLLRRVKRMAG